MYDSDRTMQFEVVMIFDAVRKHDAAICNSDDEEEASADVHLMMVLKNACSPMHAGRNREFALQLLLTHRHRLVTTTILLSLCT